MTAATMEALVLTAPGEVANRRVPVPAALEGDDVLIRVTRAGICGARSWRRWRRRAPGACPR